VTPGRSSKRNGRSAKSARSGASARKRPDAGATRRAVGPSATTLSWALSWRLAVQIVMGTLAFWLLLGYARPWPVVLVPAILLMPIGVAGFVVAFRRRVPSLLVTGGWVLFWLVEYVVVGTTSSYWGMHVMLMAYLGCALLAVGLLGTAPPEAAGAPARPFNDSR